ncbi:hypothetical protein [Leptothoe spongobia]|uniref:Uncharacterized protein n=1 Tax=Leptothoe spongobia TAU-MAC 1115 TaxID=1967444 RepID=A0A947DDH9_9CYAN|nr:hypothetical protein [Leptothoe spongobia]MBT9315016.1 hypothetical protein [Leptothoe spongobia TAU-MAC 1115]
MNIYSSNLQKLEVQRRQLEHLWQPTTPAQKIKQASSNLLRNAGQWLVQTLTEGDQLRIWTTETSEGTRWCVRNPVDDMQHQFDSEEALRVWLEQRYYNG